MRLKKFLTVLLGALLITGTGFALASCGEEKGDSTKATVKFDVNTDHETNVIKNKEVTIGKRVSQPKAYILDDNPDNLQVYGWYTTESCEERWDFKKDRVEKDMTLYAKWVEMYDVSYYVNGTLAKTDTAFKGDTVEENARLVEGFKYLGSYTDENYQTEFDYSQPISGATKIYMKRSEGIYLSDHVEDGEVSSGSLTENLAAYLGSMAGEEGWVEEYTVQTEYPSGTVEESCTYVNFGYSKVGDPYVELCRAFDISQSQIIRLWFKNLGPAASISVYFTAMLDPENNVYSETGASYSQEFCYPNWEGSDNGPVLLADDQRNMSETAEWTYVDLNLYQVYKNGYSIWGTSPYLGMIRIQTNYKNEDENDWSNVFLIKAIEGIACDVPVEDSAEVAKILENTQTVTEEVLNNASAAQASAPQGFVFPKDRACVGELVGHAELGNLTDGLAFYAENEILGREYDNESCGFSVTAPEGKYIDLSEYTTLHFSVRNYSYVESLTVYVYNDMGVPVKTVVEILPRLKDSKTYSVNLYGVFGMEGGLDRVEVQYASVGVDNLLIFEGIWFGEFVPYDTLGINFNDKFCYGFSSTDLIDVQFDGSMEGTLFSVAQSGASVTTADKTYKATTDGYIYATLRYFLPRSSNITAVTVEYKTNGEFQTPYVYEIPEESRGDEGEVTLPFVKEERGTVQALRLTFEGTGDIILNEIRYGVGETGLPLYQSYQQMYDWHRNDWFGGHNYLYDSALKASILSKAQNTEIFSGSWYIGYSTTHYGTAVPHTTKNVLLGEKSVVKIVYQNRTDVNVMNVLIGFERNEEGPADGSGMENTNYGLTIDCQMQDYEWSTLTVEIPAMYADTYLGKLTLQFAGKEIAIRAISIEANLEVANA